jgi:hypothetical protein
MMLPFSLAAGLSCPTPADLAAALAAEFHAVDEQAVDDALDALAARLSGARHADALDQLDVLTGAMAAFEPLAAPLDPHAVHIDVALDRLAGHPTALAVIGAEGGRRAGLDLAVAAADAHHVVAHRGLGVQVAYDAGLPGVRRVRPGIAAPTWRCSHQVAYALLREHLDRALRAGDIAGALRAAELRLELPVDLATRSRLEHEQRSLRARLN